MKKRFLFLAVIAVALSAGSMSQAHAPTATKDCDTWSREHPAGDTSTTHHNTVHSGDTNYDNLNDFNNSLPSVPLPNGTLVHVTNNHYEVITGGTRPVNPDTTDYAGNFSYVEVVGGGEYSGDPYYKDMGEGGYVQGRIDGAGHNVDFHVNSFGPLGEGSNPLTWNSHVEACASVDNNDKVQIIKQDVPCPLTQPQVPAQIRCKHED